MVEGAVRPCCLPEWACALHGPLRRIHGWRAPPNWSARDWREEMEAHCAAAACRAARDFDPARGIPFPAYLRMRVLHAALARYRQEWAYARRCLPLADADTFRPPDSGQAAVLPVETRLSDALACLPESSCRLLEWLFGEGRTEAEIGAALGISHQAVSKRKQAVLMDLRHRL